MGAFQSPNESSQDSGTPAPAAQENLPLIYQEVLTVITRLRSNRSTVTDAGAFRNQVKATINAAESAATRKGFSPEDVRLASFAVVAFLDESILNSNNPIFADWPRMPLQEELFGGHNAGEIFFQCIDRLMARRDSPQVADVLEIYALCLLLGFRGKYSLSGQEGARAVATTLNEKLDRIRGRPQPLSPNWAPPQDALTRRSYDPLLRGLIIGALGTLLLAILFFGGFKIALLSGASEIRSMAPMISH
jgi:type VI secretion system protein ImpK